MRIKLKGKQARKGRLKIKLPKSVQRRRQDKKNALPKKRRYA